MLNYKLIFFISTLILYACSEQSLNNSSLQFEVIAIDTVISYKWGEGQNLGQSSEFFPKNIFGLPSKNANENIPENNPSEILSLGLGGTIIVSFKNYYIIDKEGPDFIIFENVFKNPLNNKFFCEPAKVSVSIDGIEFITFPFDSSTLFGCAGLTPTKRVDHNPLNWGGDKFDLKDIHVKKIKFIKIEDISEIILNNKNHIYYDVTISGFDLDALIGLNYEIR